MTQSRLTPKRHGYFEIGTYAVVLIVLAVALWVSGGTLNPNIDGVILILTAYTLLLVLPIRKFKLSWTGFEGELERLYEESRQSPPSIARERIVDQSLVETYRRTTDPRLVLLELSVKIENKLADIARRHDLEKQNFYQIVGVLSQKEILTDPFVLNGLRFFREQRNALVHWGRASDLDKAIAVGRTLLAKLEATES